jgi:hypothetical protein
MMAVAHRFEPNESIGISRAVGNKSFPGRIMISDSCEFVATVNVARWVVLEQNRSVALELLPIASCNSIESLAVLTVVLTVFVLRNTSADDAGKGRHY